MASATTAAPDPFVDQLVPECSECSSASSVILDHSGGKFICTECGLVCGERLVTDESEWRTFSSDKGGGDDRNRVGGPSSSLLDSMELSTAVGSDPTGSSLGKWQNVVSMRGGEKALMDGFGEVSEFAQRMDLGTTIEARAKEIFKEMHESKTLRGRNRLVIVTSCLFVACRDANVDRTRKEMCRITDVDLRDLGRVVSKIQRYMRVKAQSKAAATGAPNALKRKRRTGPPLAPSSVAFMNRFCSLLCFKRPFINLATTVAERVEQMGICAGKTPATIATSCIYLVSLLKADTQRSPEDIADVATIAPVTIRNTYRILHPHRKALIPDGYVDANVIEKLEAC